MGDGADLAFDWEPKRTSIARVSVAETVAAWEALEGSDGKKRDPDRETVVQPWPYPWAGVLTECHPDGLRETYVAIDVAGSRKFVNKYDEAVSVLKDSGPALDS